MFSYNFCKTFLFSVFISIFIFQLTTNGQDKKLTFAQTYQFSEPRILNRAPSLQGWFDDENYIEKRVIDGKIILLKINAANGKETIIVNYSEINEKLPDGFNSASADEVTSDYSGFLFNRDKDLYYYSQNENEFKRLTENDDEEDNPTFSPDGKKVAFTRNHDLFVIDLNSGIETRLTFDGSDSVYNGWSSWVYMEEIIGRSTAHLAYWWSPNSEMIAFLHTDDSPVPLFPIFNSEGVHGSLEWWRYPQPGDPNPKVKLGVVCLKDNNIVWVDEDSTIDQYTAWPFWTKDSKELFYQVLNRDQDSLAILSANPLTGENRFVYFEAQPSWVEFFEDVYLFENGSGFLLRSDKDGWRHLYYYNMNGKLIKKLTDGDWSVNKIVLVDEKNRQVFFESSKDEQLGDHLYKINLDGSGLTKLTSIEGTHSTTVSPNGLYFYDTYSNLITPPKIGLFDSDGNPIRLIANRKSAIFDFYDLGTSENFYIKTSDGVELPATWVLPPEFNINKKYPVVFSVYGGPGRKDVENKFSALLERFFLADNNIIYFSVDHRGSGHFGKKSESLMYRNLGKWEMNDYIEAVKWLKQKSFVDTTKIGIVGGSYGGYVAALALTYAADYFNYGIAEYSVTDWRLYDDIYTERYMDTPDENPEGYDFGSVLSHIQNYKGKLLLVHGMMDENVHMQNTLQVAEAFTNADKDFELMLYPGARHGVGFSKWNHLNRLKMNFWFKNFFRKEYKEEINR